MHLTTETVAGYVALQPGSEANNAERIERLRLKIPDLDLQMRRVALDDHGEVVASLRLFEPYAGHFGLVQPRWRAGSEDRLAELAAELVTVARARGLTRLHTRLNLDSTPPEYQAALETLGFVVRIGRTEFKTPISALPDEQGTPIGWVSYEALGLKEAGALFERAGAGPQWEDTDVGVDLIEGYLAQEGMYVGPDCVQVGSLDGTPVAIVIAQVEIATGWSTITFMGIVPERRGHGLGKWVHRHGMAMMRAQGGSLYHGGTSDSNGPC